MPRNVSRSPHELATYTFGLLYSEGFARGAGRILADRIEFFSLVPSVFTREASFSEGSKAKNQSYECKGPLRNQRPFLFPVRGFQDERLSAESRASQCASLSEKSNSLTANISIMLSSDPQRENALRLYSSSTLKTFVRSVIGSVIFHQRPC